MRAGIWSMHGVGGAATPCELFALGASLTRYNLREPEMLVVLKMMVQPLLMWLLATQVFDAPPV